MHLRIEIIYFKLQNKRLGAQQIKKNLRGQLVTTKKTPNTR